MPSTSVPSSSFSRRLDDRLRSHGTHLCVGLDPDPAKLPASLRALPPIEGLTTFLRGIVAGTREHCAAYKLQLGGFLAFGAEGVGLLPTVLKEIGADHLRILDLKAGDIGNTMALYAEGVLHRLGFDAMTVSPFLGWETIEAVAQDASKGLFVLAHTSNPGSKDIQERNVEGRPLWEELLEGIRARAERGNLGAVVGATFPQAVQRARQVLGASVPLLVPGVGSQGGDLEATLRAGRGAGAGALLINSSRGILFASSGADWSEAAGREAARLGKQASLSP